LDCTQPSTLLTADLENGKARLDWSIAHLPEALQGSCAAEAAQKLTAQLQQLQSAWPTTRAVKQLLSGMRTDAESKQQAALAKARESRQRLLRQQQQQQQSQQQQQQSARLQHCDERDSGWRDQRRGEEGVGGVPGLARGPGSSRLQQLRSGAAGSVKAEHSGSASGGMPVGRAGVNSSTCANASRGEAAPRASAPTSAAAGGGGGGGGATSSILSARARQLAMHAHGATGSASIAALVGRAGGAGSSGPTGAKRRPPVHPAQQLDAHLGAAKRAKTGQQQQPTRQQQQQQLGTAPAGGREGSQATSFFSCGGGGGPSEEVDASATVEHVREYVTG